MEVEEIEKSFSESSKLSALSEEVRIKITQVWQLPPVLALFMLVQALLTKIAPNTSPEDFIGQLVLT